MTVSRSVKVLPRVCVCTAPAFSLIELLVVVGIIAVLVAIAAPSAVRVRQHAREVNCRITLVRLSVAMPMYASDNGGFLPPGPIERAYWPGDADRGSPFEMYDYNRIDRTDLSSRDGWYGFGLLWKYGYVDRGEVYFCPAAESKGGVGYDHAWPRTFDANRNPSDGKTRIFGSLAYRGGLSSQAGTPNGPLNIYRNSGALAVLADNPCSGRMWHEGKYNVAFLDGRSEAFHFDQPVVPDGRLYSLWKAINAFWE